eukprot:TRINITY_DN8594_c0_g1_i2.p1 TRINITY_DN8594_c0_g1~~TRINITY_DN8594_c0_g1_i2.p1  ORF type:complete len:103 (-),score=14.97 TRINITY_DN8594_c0_g1_i2:57-365(-)
MCIRDRYQRRVQESMKLQHFFQILRAMIFFESTGYVIEVVNDWLKMYLYDVNEDDWYYCYRSYKDFTGIRFEGYEELLASFLKKLQSLIFIFFNKQNNPQQL